MPRKGEEGWPRKGAKRKKGRVKTGQNSGQNSEKSSRKILVSVIIPPAILGPEMAAPILWAPGIFWFFLLENPHAHKIPRFRGGGGCWGFLEGGGGTLRLLNALNSEDRGLKVRFSLATIAFDRESAQMSQILSSQGKNAPSNPYPHYLVRLATSRKCQFYFY